MKGDEIIQWLLKGDVSIQYQTKRDLLGSPDAKLQRRIAEEGWGRKLLALRNKNGFWGKGFYNPKWTSTHYTLLDLKNLAFPEDHALIKESIAQILQTQKNDDGGLFAVKSNPKSDVCVNGMFLNYASWFGAEEEKLKSIVDYLLGERMPDGGFNCRSVHSGSVHSSLHSTLSVIEGIHQYKMRGYKYRLKELIKAQKDSHEFILIHRLFRSHKTGNIIKSDFLKLHYPCRWFYDVLRAMDYFQEAGVKWDSRMQDAIDHLIEKRGKDGKWRLDQPHRGRVHFEMEKAGQASRWITLRAMRVLKHYNK